MNYFCFRKVMISPLNDQEADALKQSSLQCRAGTYSAFKCRATALPRRMAGPKGNKNSIGSIRSG